MRALLFLVLLFITTITPCVADNVTIEVLENLDGDFYISYNDDLIQCDTDDFCTFDVSNYTTNINTTEIELSKNDMKKIAQYVSLEIDMNGIETGGINKTYYDTTQIVTRNEVIDGILPFIRNTLMPETDNVTALKANLTASHIIISDLKSDVKILEGKIEGHDEKIKLKDDELFNTKIAISGIAILFAMSLLLQGNRVQRGINLFRNMRK